MWWFQIRLQGLLGANRIQRRLCPGRMGALEKLLRGFAERDGEYVVKPEQGTTFDSLMGAYGFYRFLLCSQVIFMSKLTYLILGYEFYS